MRPLAHRRRDAGNGRTLSASVSRSVSPAILGLGEPQELSCSGLGQPPVGSFLSLSLSLLIWELGTLAIRPLRDWCENQVKGFIGSTMELTQTCHG